MRTKQWHLSDKIVSIQIEGCKGGDRRERGGNRTNDVVTVQIQCRQGGERAEGRRESVFESVCPSARSCVMEIYTDDIVPPMFAIGTRWLIVGEKKGVEE